MKYFIIVLIGLAILAGVIGFNMYNRTHIELNASTVDYTMTPTLLLTAFESDETSANAKYLGKTIEVKGIIKNIELTGLGGSIYLDTGNELVSIKCEFDNNKSIETFHSGDQITIIGVCTGILMDVVLNRCVTVK